MAYFDLFLKNIYFKTFVHGNLDFFKYVKLKYVS